MEVKANFGKAVNNYTKFRPLYPDGLFSEIFSWIDPSNYNKAMDIGAGTGLSSIPLSEKFKETIAVEPDFNMYTEMNKYFESRNSKIVTKNEFIEKLDPDYNTYDLVTFGTSFYWTDGEAVLQKINKMLKENGVLAIYRYDLPLVPNEIRGIISSESENVWNKFRHERLRDTDYSNRTVRESKLFSKVETKMIENIINLTAEEIIGFFASTSYVSAYLRSLENPEKYLNDLYIRLKNNLDTDKVPVDFRLELILAKK